MIACTSISPTHLNKDIQHKAVDSWIELGMSVHSFNSPEEVEKLKSEYPKVKFIETRRTFEKTYGKPLVSINAVLDWAKDQSEDEFCLVNSDIEIKADKDILKRVSQEMVSAIVLGNRVDYNDNYDTTAHPYTLGIDVFFIHKKWMQFYPQSMHCFGMTFWDYFIPYTAIKAGIDVVFIQQKIAFHKAHSAQYSNDNWLKSGRFFLWENSLYQFDDTRQIGSMSTFVYNFIYNASTRKEI